MMFPVSMVKGIGADEKSKHNHPCFKINIMNNVDPKQWKTAEKQRQQCTMYSTGQRGPDT